jgi:hypothetical protein
MRMLETSAPRTRVSAAHVLLSRTTRPEPPLLSRASNPASLACLDQSRAVHYDHEPTCPGRQGPGSPGGPGGAAARRVTQLQGLWEALGEELEAKRGRLRLAEAILELRQRREEEAAPEEQAEPEAGGLPRDPREEHASQADQASGKCQTSPSEGTMRSLT